MAKSIGQNDEKIRFPVIATLAFPCFIYFLDTGPKCSVMNTDSAMKR